MNKEELNKLSKKIIGIAIEIHKKLGPGFPEKIYQRILFLELNKAGLKTEKEKKIIIKWEEEIIGYQLVDLLVKDMILIELKIGSEINNLHKAQLLSYLKASNKKLGLILNFGNQVLEIKRIVKNF